MISVVQLSHSEAMSLMVSQLSMGEATKDVQNMEQLAKYGYRH